MTSDRYTRVILTIIAGGVLWIAAHLAPPIVTTALAARGPTRSDIDVNIVSIDGKPFAPFQVSVLKPALPVKVE